MCIWRSKPWGHSDKNWTTQVRRTGIRAQVETVHIEEGHNATDEEAHLILTGTQCRYATLRPRPFHERVHATGYGSSASEERYPQIL